MAEWTRTDLGNNQAAFNARVAHLTGSTPGGLNGAYVLTLVPTPSFPVPTVTDDGAPDTVTVTGGSGINWDLLS